MKKIRTKGIVFLVGAIIGLLTTLPSVAQSGTEAKGKSATVITMDGSSCGMLWAQNADSSPQAVCGFLRHKQAPIQLLS